MKIKTFKRNAMMANISGSLTGSLTNPIVSYPQTLWKTISNPNAYGAGTGDNFGFSVDICGNYAIVGAHAEADSGGSVSGKAYIFDVSTGLLLHILNNPNIYGTSTNDRFGISVAISDKYAVVGANTEDAAEGTDTGKAYVFDVNTGLLLLTINNPNAYGTVLNDNFGHAVDVDGEYIAVSAINEDDANGVSSGKVYIFNTSGILKYTLNNPNPYGTSANDVFGNSIHISNNRIIIGAYAESDSGGKYSGKAYIFDLTTGLLLKTLNNPNAYSTSYGDYFGVGVGMFGNYAIVGAHSEGDASGTGSGKAYIFDVSTGLLLHILNNPNIYGTSTNDHFGTSVAIYGNYAIVGAFGEGDAPGTCSGKAYVFNVTTGALLKTLDNPNPNGTSANDYFAYSLAMSGSCAIVSAWNEDGPEGADSGKVYIFK